MLEHTGNLDAFFDEMMQDPNYRSGYQAELNKLTSAAALLKVREQSDILSTMTARIENER